MSKILKLYERSIDQQGQSDAEFELSKALFKKEQERMGVKICRASDGSLFLRKIQKRIETELVCFCGAKYKASNGVKYYHNYGGISKKCYVCSKECLSIVQELIGARMSRNCSKLF